jgi:hypothetical protein
LLTTQAYKFVNIARDHVSILEHGLGPLPPITELVEYTGRDHDGILRGVKSAEEQICEQREARIVTRSVPARESYPGKYRTGWHGGSTSKGQKATLFLRR